MAVSSRARSSGMLPTAMPPALTTANQHAASIGELAPRSSTRLPGTRPRSSTSTCAMRLACALQVGIGPAHARRPARRAGRPGRARSRGRAARWRSSGAGNCSSGSSNRNSGHCSGGGRWSRAKVSMRPLRSMARKGSTRCHCTRSRWARWGRTRIIGAWRFGATAMARGAICIPARIVPVVNETRGARSMMRAHGRASPVGHLAAGARRRAGVSRRHAVPRSAGRRRIGAGLPGQRQRDHAVAARRRACRRAAALRRRRRADRRASTSSPTSAAAASSTRSAAGRWCEWRAPRACARTTCRRACWCAPTSARRVDRLDAELAAYAPQTIERLADLGVRLVGIDTASIDPADSKTLRQPPGDPPPRPARAREPGARRRARRRLRTDRAAAEADHAPTHRRCAPCCASCSMTDDPRRLPRARRARPAARAARAVRAARRRDLPRRQLARRAAQGDRRRACSRCVQRRMGPRPDPQLEQRRLDRPAAARSATRSRAWSAPAPGELVVADSTSVNLFKVLSAALDDRSAPTRRSAA